MKDGNSFIFIIGIIAFAYMYISDKITQKKYEKNYNRIQAIIEKNCEISELEEVLEKKIDVFIVRGILEEYRKYFSYSDAFYRFNGKATDENYLKLSSSYNNKTNFIKKYWHLPCEHGVEQAFIFIDKCEQCKAIKYIPIEKICSSVEIEIEKKDEKDFFVEKYRNAFKRKMKPERIGAYYERYIGYLFEVDNYDVVYNGILSGKKDDGVDIIAKRNNEIIIIQCKWYGQKSNIHINAIRQLNDKLNDEKRKNRNFTVIGMLITANDNLDEDAKNRLYRTKIIHKVIAYDYAYPLIKCNINKSNGTKLYHFPDRGQYDRIKITQSDGECYVEHSHEAEFLGFTKAL